MTLFDHTFYINLAARTDRLAHLHAQFEKIGIVGERMNAVKMRNGAVGCTMSHIHCLEIAKSRNLPHVFICEDDITFLNPQLLRQNVEKFEKSNIQWDVLIIGGNNCPPFVKVSDYCIRVSNNQTTTGYIVKQHYYDTLIVNFRESASKLMREPLNRAQYAVDIYWKSLQQKDRWFMIIPPTVIQYEDFSDIEGTTVNYAGLMLDLEKEWLMQPQHMQFTHR